MQRDGDNRSGLHVHRMLGLVSQMRAPILHLGDAGIGIVRMRPVVVGAFLGTPAIQLRQLLTRGRFDAAFRRQPHQKLFVALSGIAPHHRSQCRVGFQRRCVYADCCPFEQLLFSQYLKHPLEHRLMRLHIHQPPGSRDGRMIRHALIQRDPYERSNRQAIAGAPCDSALRIDPLEIAHHQQPKIDPW